MCERRYKKEEWGKSVFSSSMVHGMVKVQVVLGGGLFLASIIELVYKIGKDDD